MYPMTGVPEGSGMLNFRKCIDKLKEIDFKQSNIWITTSEAKAVYSNIDPDKRHQNY